MAPELPRPASADQQAPTRGSPFVIPQYLKEDIDPAQSTWPLAAYCFITGWIDVTSFSAVFVWCAFQTGNTLQLGLALARTFSPGEDRSWHIADRQALTSLLTFLFGAFLGRIGDRIGAKTRLWLVLGTFLQALFTMAGAIVLWRSGQGSVASDRGDPSWTNALSYVGLGFISASMGLQGIMGKRINTQFATSIVLTTVWCELMADPKLFNLRQIVTTRDHKVLGIFALFLGGFLSRAALQSIGTPAALGIGCGVRVLITISWLFVPAKVKAGK
ncbi:hypothetical protein K488DRAFT_39447 [Vararia minispora EC-137]|uniref:Uncharacterized protein n=1 Tax=Vararia minispora EC-137 TaxID=1314806 RepID=A0ACB8R0B8_9AGAM|nr:hypothetical protein K488DRAFT_39447 [Vararia minispora EC-137]